MPILLRCLLTALGAACTLPVVAGSLSIAFLQPENYTDGGYARYFASARDRADVQHDIEQHLQRLAERGLPPDESLKIDVLDIDLAGRFELSRLPGTSDVRAISDVTWPRIKLRYTLSRDGQVLASAEEQLVDMSYLLSVNRYASTDRLRYERAMLDDWFERRIVKR